MKHKERRVSVNANLEKQVATDYLASAEGSDAARLQFMMGLWETQALIRPKDTRFEPPARDEARDALASGKHLFAVQAPQLDRDEYLKAVEAVSDYVAETAALPAEQSAALADLDFASLVAEEDFADASRTPAAWIASRAEAAVEASGGAVSAVTAAFVLHAALVPFLVDPAARAMDVLGEFDFHGWGSGDCPVCGTPAAMGRMGESTHLKGAERVLWCGTCHAEWAYDRIRCARCGCRSAEQLHYTFAEEDPAYRLHLCDSCHGYVRFVFEGDLRRPVAMLVEDVVSAPLESVALKSGYSASGDGGDSGTC